MATVTAGPNHAIDMLDPIDLTGFGLSIITTVISTKVTSVSDPAGLIWTMQGSGFSAAAGGFANATVTSITQTTSSGGAVNAVSGFSVRFDAMAPFIVNNDGAGLSALLFNGNDSVTGTGLADRLYGFAGNDTLAGGAGDDILSGGAGTDKLDGGSGIDTISYAEATAAVSVSLALTAQQNTGGAGLDTLSGIENITGSAFNDTLGGTAGANTIRGGDGIDTVSYASATSGVTVDLRYSTASGGSPQDTGGGGVDVLLDVENAIGSAYNDKFIAVVGSTRLNGGAGSDTVSFIGFENLAEPSLGVIVSLADPSANGAGMPALVSIENVIGSNGDDQFTGTATSNIFDGGLGVDTVSYASATSGVAVSLATSASQNTVGSGNDKLLNIERLLGTAFNDTLAGNASNNLLGGGAGADRLDGGAGNDILFSSSISLIYGQKSDDIGAQVDTLIGGTGDDILFAGYGDNVDGGANDGRGDELFISFQGAVEGVVADFTQPTIVVGGGVITEVELIGWVEGGNFSDTIILGGTSPYSSFTKVYGMGGDDTLIADYYTGNLYGGDGADFVDGRNSQYLKGVDGGAGDDTLYTNPNMISDANGGAGNDTIYAAGAVRGGEGDDLIVLSYNYYGSYGAQIYGDAGADEIRGTESDVSIYGGAGNDLFVTGAGNDTFDGGTGVDTIDVSNATGAVNLNLWTGVVSGLGIGVDAVVNVENAIGGARADTIRGSAYDNRLEGGAGGDNINGGGGVDTASYITSAGAVVVALDGAVSGGDATGDTLVAIENLTGSTFNDTLQGNAGANVLDGYTGTDMLSGGGGDDMYIVNSSTDRVTEDSAGGGVDLVKSTVSWMLGANLENLTLAGAKAVNASGNALGNVIIGNSAANVIAGAGGHDTLTGGAGADVFVFASASALNSDTITDFVAGVDKIRLDNAVFAALSEGALPDAAFYAGSAAHDGDDRVIYNAATGNLYYDGDGTGTARPAILLATLTTHPALSAADFVVV